MIRKIFILMVLTILLLSCSENAINNTISEENNNAFERKSEVTDEDVNLVDDIEDEEVSEEEEVIQEHYIVVGVERLNFRSEANTSSEIIDVVDYGDSLLVQSTTEVEGQLWYQVKYNNTPGFVIGKFVMDNHQDRTNALYSPEKEIFGYYTPEDFTLLHETYVLRSLRGMIFKEYKVEFNGETAFLFEPIESIKDGYPIEDHYVLAFENNSYDIELTDVPTKIYPINGNLVVSKQFEDYKEVDLFLESQMIELEDLYNFYVFKDYLVYEVQQESRSLEVINTLNGKEYLLYLDFRIDSLEIGSDSIEIEQQYSTLNIQIEDDDFDFRGSTYSWDGDEAQVFLKYKDVEVTEIILTKDITLEKEDELSQEIEVGTRLDIIEIKEDDSNRKWYKVEVNEHVEWISSEECLEYLEISTLDDFYNALASHRHLKLTKELANIDIVLPPIEGINNLVIEGDKEKPQRFYTKSYHTVLTFRNCNNVRLIGLDIGHLFENVCNGNVIDVYNCENFIVEDAILFGCGVIGIDIKSSDVSLYRSRIWDCSRSAFSVDLESTLKVYDSIIEDVPALFDELDYTIKEHKIEFNNSILDASIIRGTMYNDLLWMHGLGIYKLNKVYDGIKFNQSIYVPKPTDQLDDIYTDMTVLLELENKDIGMMRYFLDEDDEKSLHVFVDADKLPAANKESISEIINILSKDLEAFDIKNLSGSIVSEKVEEVIWEWNLDLQDFDKFEVFYPFTEKYWGVSSLDLRSYIDTNIGINDLSRGGTDISVFPSQMIEGELIHKLAFDMISSAGDYPDYIGTPLIMVYNQSQDDFRFEIDGHHYSDFSQEIVRVKIILRDLEKMYGLFLDHYETLIENAKYKYRYDLTSEDVLFVEYLIQKHFGKAAKNEFYNLYEIVKEDGVYYSNTLIRGYPTTFSGGEFIFDSMGEIIVYTLDFYTGISVKINLKIIDDTIKIMGYEDFSFMDRSEEWDQNYILHMKLYPIFD